MTPQTQRLYNYLLANRTIQPLEAWQKLGIYRLAAVVHLLKQHSAELKFNIATKRIDVKNQFNEKCHVAQYVMEIHE